MDPAKVKYRVAFGTFREAVSSTFPYQLVQMTNRVAKTQENLQREQKANYNGEKKHNKADGSIKRCAGGQTSRRLVSRMKIGALGLAEASAPRSTFFFFLFHVNSVSRWGDGGARRGEGPMTRDFQWWAFAAPKKHGGQWPLLHCKGARARPKGNE